MSRTDQALAMVAVGAVCLGVGFVSGREYMKYELRTALADGLRGLSQVVNGTLPTPVASPPPAPVPPSTPATPVKASPIEVSMTEKGWSPANPDRFEYEDHVTFKLLIKDVSDRKVRAFDGVLHITDLLDNTIIDLHVAINDAVSPTSPLTWPGSMKYNQFMTSHQSLRNADFANIKTSFHAHKVLFDDGTVQVFD